MARTQTAKSPKSRGALRGRKPTRPQTASRTEAAMTERLRTLEPGSQRHQVLSVAIDFKRSWLELARALVEVRDRGAYKEWGYRTFEAYAQHELHLRRETAQKLVRSFEFMSSHEPRRLEEMERAPETPLPSFQALDILAEARQNPYLSESDYRDLHEQVFREDPAPNQLRKVLRERAPEPAKPPEEPAVRLRRCLSLAERLYGMVLEEEDVPETVRHAVEQAVGGLRKLLDE